MYMPESLLSAKCSCIFLGLYAKYEAITVVLCERVCVCVRKTGVEILRHVTAGGLMPTGKDGAEKEMTVAKATPSWSG